MVSGFDVAKKILEYLNGSSKLDDFRAWLLSAYIEAASQQNKSVEEADAARFLVEIEARYAEFSDELLDEVEWRRALARLLAPRAQSAESLLLTYFYSPASVFSSEPAAVSGNGSQPANSQPSELAAVA